MFTNQTDTPQIQSNVIRKVSVVESYYNPLKTEIKKAFKALWKIHFEIDNDKTFYNRMARPNIEDYALICYFLKVHNEFEFLQAYYKNNFKEDGQPYPTYLDFETSII